MTDSSLLQEIEADLQRQHYEKLWKKFGPFIIAGILAIIIGTAAYTAWRSHQNHIQQIDTEKVMDTASNLSLSQTQRIEALAQIAQTSQTPGPVIAARLQGASQAMAAGDMAKAGALYDAMAQDTRLDPVYRHYGDLLYVQSQMDTGDASALLARLGPLLNDEAWGFSAREYAGYLTLKMGKRDEARELFKQLAAEPTAPRTLAERAREMAGWIAQTK